MFSMTTGSAVLIATVAYSPPLYVPPRAIVSVFASAATPPSSSSRTIMTADNGFRGMQRMLPSYQPDLGCVFAMGYNWFMRMALAALGVATLAVALLTYAAAPTSVPTTKAAAGPGD